MELRYQRRGQPAALAEVSSSSTDPMLIAIRKAPVQADPRDGAVRQVRVSRSVQPQEAATLSLSAFPLGSHRPLHQGLPQVYLKAMAKASAKRKVQAGIRAFLILMVRVLA